MAALAINSCSFGPPTPPLPSPPLPLPCKLLTVAATPRPTSKVAEDGWGRRCISTMACVIIGSTMGFGVGEAEQLALAGDHVKPSLEAGSSGGKVMRWSGKRSCPPWHVNSLESVVPEDLPRPSTAGRRSNKFAAYKNAPAVGSWLQYSSSCFSL